MNSKAKELRKFKVNTHSNTNLIQQKSFCDNCIKTAKYNIFSFLPLALFYQFRNFFNLFFLFDAIIQSIPMLNIMEPLSAIMPFLVVLMISLIREAIEDFRKYKYDKQANNSIGYIFKQKTFIPVKWRKMHVGDIIKINQNEILPVDIIVIKSSTSNGFCYLETTNLDGESSLKSRESLSSFHNLIQEESDINNHCSNMIIEVDQPNIDIYNLEGAVLSDDNKKDIIYFDIKNILLRGGRLKNTEYVYGIITYTGKDTKLMQNINHNSHKISNIDKKTNLIVLSIMCFFFIFCAICTGVGTVFRNKYLPDYSQGLIKGEYMLYYNPKKGDDHSLGIAQIFTSNFVIYSTFIPLSIIIVLAIVKGFQALSIEYLETEFRKEAGDKVKCFSPSLQEEMGMIKYIFTDKTGTLTKNEMEFKSCSIFTSLFTEDESSNFTIVNNCISANTCPSTENLNCMNLSQKVKTKIIEALNHELPCIDKSLLSNPIEEFFLNIALNHNVLTEYDKDKQSKEFQGVNPDEVALVTFASEIGFIFIKRDNTFIELSITKNGNELKRKYEVINQFDFTSQRQRSSIIVKNTETNEIMLYTKGSDKKIFNSIDLFSSKNLLTITKEHVDSFARKGLRTLCYSAKVINQFIYDEWKIRYEELKYKSITNKDLYEELEDAIAEIEVNSILLGATALEDKLQDEVKEDLHNFIDAGISVWMITGDKMDTAESIGHSCRLFSDDTEVFKLKETNKLQEVIDRLKEIKIEMSKIRYEKLNEEIITIPPVQLNYKENNDYLIDFHSLKSIQEEFDVENKRYIYSCLNKMESMINSPIEQRKFSYDKPLSHSCKYNKIPESDELNRNISLDRTSILQYMVNNNIFDNYDDDTYDKLSILMQKENNPNIIQTDIKCSAPNILGVPLNEKHFQKYLHYCNDQIKKYEKVNKPPNISKAFNPIIPIPRIKKKYAKNRITSKIGVNYALIIEGLSISHCIQKGEARELFWELIQKSQSVICCRCSPIQKGLIVDYIKKQSKAITLAIGDGGNDVNMIKTANVGIGLFGKEGYQAAYNSDFAISKFKYLKRLIFYNGHFGLGRIAYYIYFYFFKNILFTFPQFFLGCFSGFSGTILYDNWYYMGFNSFVTVTPIASKAVVDESFDPEFHYYPASNALLKYLLPDIYKEYRDSIPFNVAKFILIFFTAIIFALPVYFIPAFCFKYGIKDALGTNFCFWDVSLATYLGVVIIHFFIICLDTMLYNWIIDGLYGLQLLVDIAFFIIYQSCNYDHGLSGDLYEILSSLLFWIIFILSCAVCLIPFYIFRRIEFFFGKMIVNQIKQSKCEEYFIQKFYQRKIGIMTQASRSIAKFKKIYKMDEDKEYETLADQQMKKIVEQYKLTHQLKDILVK